MTRRGGVGAVLGISAAAVALAGCSLKQNNANLVNGKQLFAQKCGACHTLARAGTTGTTGPDLDAAFAQSRADGLGQSTFRGVVEQQIEDPNRNPQLDPSKNDKTTLPAMPPNLVTGQDARDVAAYVASAVAKPGKDSGRLASVGAQKAAGTAVEKNGTLDIPIAGAGLAFKYANATAKAGQVKITAQNPQSIGHNIAITGNGVNQKGQVVTNATSTVTVNLKPGKYTFYCSVPGHREGGMQGTLTVK
jgi:plastocyanin